MASYIIGNKKILFSFHYPVSLDIELKGRGKVILTALNNMIGHTDPIGYIRKDIKKVLRNIFVVCVNHFP